MVSRSLIKLSNSLNKASYTLSIPEKRLVMLAISRLDRESDTCMISVTASDFANCFSLNRDGVYRTLKSASEKLWARTLVTEDGTKYRWIITSKYNDGGAVELEFHPKLKPHLLQLKDNFTQYFLHRAADFKLMYTWRLFELLMQFRTTGMLVIDLEDLKTALDIPNTYNRDFGKIREKVIDPAITEILEKDGLKVTWNTIKTGRKVTGLSFKFPIEQQITLPLEKKAKISPKEAKLQKDAKPSTSQKNAEKNGFASLEELAKQYGVDDLLKAKKMN
ncbi:MAG: RepB family plasmid replication initiator protein [Acinetobacter sp.]|nr:MAG: RepB family plasmid replication initiator protein [Acinetobacter sp.]